MTKLTLKFGQSVLQEVGVGTQAVTVGRSPDNDIRIDNPAVSNHHAKFYSDHGRLMVEDLNSLNGTFVNEQRVRCVAVKHGDAIAVGKHFLIVEENGGSASPAGMPPKAAVPKIDETMMLDTSQRRELLEKIAATGERSQLAPDRLKVATLVITRGKTDRSEYLLSSKLTVIGKSPMASIKMNGWFAPKVAAQINKRDDGYYIGAAERVPKINGAPIHGPAKLAEGDVITIGRLQLTFIFRD